MMRKGCTMKLKRPESNIFNPNGPEVLTDEQLKKFHAWVSFAIALFIFSVFVIGTGIYALLRLIKDLGGF